MAAEWSPCSRYIAVVWLFAEVRTIDAVTLQQLHRFLTHYDGPPCLSFSPDSHQLTQVSGHGQLTSWDLQTGGLVSTIPLEPHISDRGRFSSTRSLDGNVVALAHLDWDDPTHTAISTYDLLSKRYMTTFSISGSQIVAPLWTHGDSLQFATILPELIVVWEVGFTTQTSTPVKGLPIPDDIDQMQDALFLPAHSWLAFIDEGVVLVWDAENSKFLLNFSDINKPLGTSFSSDGHFFACGTKNWEAYLWKGSSTGYILHQKLTFSTDSWTRPLLSPDGDSLIVLAGSAIHLCHTRGPITSPSNLPTQSANQADFIMGFSPDEALAAFAQRCESTVTVLDLQSGDPQLSVETGMKVLGLQVTMSTIIVVGEKEVVTWNLPNVGCAFNTRVNIGDSVCTIVLDPDHTFPTDTMKVCHTSISPNFSYLAVVWHTVDKSRNLNIYDMSTGKYLVHTVAKEGVPWFTLDEQEVWCGYSDEVEGWTITKHDKSGLIELEPILGPILRSHPWSSSCDYEVTSDGWVLNSGGKYLLWLPHHWRSNNFTDTMWSGRFLGVLNYNSEAPILELTN